ncbi:MAG TPA: hypothetical protein VMU42_03900 [Candidatus Sulfotelmatobacter sp.]|nr:hypothetical protein [Candidatus Sulfotelmatobacter sp.]
MQRQGGGQSGLGCAEHLLVWSLRHLVAGRGDCPLIADAFSAACGEDAAEVFATFRVVIRMLVYAGRRRLCVARPGQNGVSACERQLLNIIAAVQAGDRPRFEAHLSWLARAEARHELAMAVQAVARALSTHQLILPLPAAAPPGRTECGLRLVAPIASSAPRRENIG